MILLVATDNMIPDDAILATVSVSGIHINDNVTKACWTFWDSCGVCRWAGDRVRIEDGCVVVYISYSYLQQRGNLGKKEKNTDASLATIDGKVAEYSKNPRIRTYYFASQPVKGSYCLPLQSIYSKNPRIRTYYFVSQPVKGSYCLPLQSKYSKKPRIRTYYFVSQPVKGSYCLPLQSKYSKNPRIGTYYFVSWPVFLNN